MQRPSNIDKLSGLHIPEQLTTLTLNFGDRSNITDLDPLKSLKVKQLILDIARTEIKE